MPLRQQIQVKDNKEGPRSALVLLSFAILIFNEELPGDPTRVWSHALN